MCGTAVWWSGHASACTYQHATFVLFCSHQPLHSPLSCRLLAQSSSMCLPTSAVLLSLPASLPPFLLHLPLDPHITDAHRVPGVRPGGQAHTRARRGPQVTRSRWGRPRVLLACCAALRVAGGCACARPNYTQRSRPQRRCVPVGRAAELAALLRIREDVRRRSHPINSLLCPTLSAFPRCLPSRLCRPVSCAPSMCPAHQKWTRRWPP